MNQVESYHKIGFKKEKKVGKKGLLIKSVTICIVLILVAAFLAVGCESDSTTPTGTPVTLQFSMMTMVQDEYIDQEYLAFANAIEERTDGQYQIEFYYGGTLGNDSEMPVKVPSGTVEMANTNLSWWSQVVPSTAILYTVGLVDTDAIWRAEDGELGERIAEELEEQANTKLIAFSTEGPATVWWSRSKPITEPSDLEGMSIRTYSASHTAFFESMGAAVVSMAGPEVYTALERGTLDAVAGLAGAERMAGWSEVAPYITFGTLEADGVGAIVMNLDTWNSLSEDIQTIFLEEGRKFQDAQRIWATKLIAEDEAAIKMSSNVEEITILTPEQLEAFYEQGRAGQEAMIKEICGEEEGQELLDLLEKYL
jgi:TRAP-type C4-dicarboxylate transport system substrate-binding protein